MRQVVVTGCPRAALDEVDELASFGVATVHEASGQSGYLGPGIRPIYPGTRIGGTAVTVLCRPGSNLMVHAAVEQCRAGDILVVTTTSPSADGYFGELIGTSALHRGVRGLVTTTGARDIADLQALGFPVFSGAVSAHGTLKTAGGAVNVPVVIGGQTISPGDAVVADDDGVTVVPRAQVGPVLDAARQRAAHEDATREALQGGALGLDRYGLREVMAGLGVEYVDYESYLDQA